MNRDRLSAVLLIGLVVVALGAAAATLDAGTLDGGEDPDPRMPEPPNRTAPGGDPGAGTAITCPAVLNNPGALVATAAVGALLGLVAFAVIRSILVAGLVATPPVIGLLSFCPGALPGTIPYLDAIVQAILSPTTLVLALLASVGGAIAYLYVKTGTAEPFEGEDLHVGGTDLEALGAAAGAAADRIEKQADVTNEVYRAWKEMTGLLDVASPETTTPAEFADAATDAGMAREDVSTLTRLFEEVRYGGFDPAQREDDAVDALRGIESTYAPDGEASGGDGDAARDDGGDRR